MSPGMEIRLLLLSVALCLSTTWAYNVPQATVKVYSPQGFEVSIPDEPGISLFAFHGKLNDEMDDLSDQTWATDIVTPRNGRWTYRNRNQKLQTGDVLYYWTTVRYHGVDHHNFNQRHVVGGNTQRIDAHGSKGGHQTIIVNGQPTINIHVE